MRPTVAEVRRWLEDADERKFATLERSLAADTRVGVRDALARTRRRLDAEREERERLRGLYDFERRLARERSGLDAPVVVGLDEVGRGPLAGPLAVGAVVLPAEPLVEGLNDSKQLSAEAREDAAARVRACALAFAVEYVEPQVIDEIGMTASLLRAFRAALGSVEGAGVRPDVVLLDGNPLRLDAREVNVVKGDAKCASIAAASVVAKVERDALMCRLANDYPAYGFAANKGYASAAHIEALRREGLSPVHRASFCRSILAERRYEQDTLF